MRAIPLALILAVATSGCVRGGAGLFAAVAATAIVTAAIVSTRPPPPPRVIIVPEARPGYAYQPGYWVLQGEEWTWVDGQWVPDRQGYAWSPAHWESQPDGTWRFSPGQWVPQQ
jgi:hypothetical protein